MGARGRANTRSRGRPALHDANKHDQQGSEEEEAVPPLLVCVVHASALTRDASFSARGHEPLLSALRERLHALAPFLHP